METSRVFPQSRQQDIGRAQKAELFGSELGTKLSIKINHFTREIQHNIPAQVIVSPFFGDLFLLLRGFDPRWRSFMSLAEFAYTVLLKPLPLRLLANSMLRRVIPETLHIKGAKVRSNPDDPVISGALTFGVYENDEINFFHDTFKENMVFVDVGANIGLYTALALSKNARSILCVEPHSESRLLLEQTIRLNTGDVTKVKIAPCAASDKPQSATLFKNPDNKGDNRLYPDPLCPESEEIHSDTLDAICEQNGIQEIDFLKIDTQGSEAKVVQGGRRILSASRPCIIMSEFWPYGLQKCGDDAREYLSLLESLGFQLFELRKNTLTPFDHESIIWRTAGRKYTNIVGFKN